MNKQELQTLARFWNNVDVIPHSQGKHCWEWKGGKLKNGYGMASVGQRKLMLAHRFVASLTDDIVGKIVMHTCDNPGCVRPEHLIVGTQVDNLADMQRKDRQNKSLYADAVRDIRTGVLTRKQYAKKYQVTIPTIKDAQLRITWKNVI